MIIQIERTETVESSESNHAGVSISIHPRPHATEIKEQSDLSPSVPPVFTV